LERKRLAQERSATAAIAEALEEQLTAALKPGPAAADLGLGDKILQAAILAVLQEAAELGAEAAMGDLADLGIAVDWALVNEAARDWARGYTMELVRGIDDTSRELLQKEIAQWMESGEPLSKLTETLSDYFGEKRAALIAMTETTRAYNEGNIAGWKEAGLADREPEERPPLHPGCRCTLSITEASSGDWVYIWNTGNDEIVCPDCVELGDKSNVGIAMEKR